MIVEQMGKIEFAFCPQQILAGDRRREAKFRE